MRKWEREKGEGQQRGAHSKTLRECEVNCGVVRIAKRDGAA